jgi:hypothetical protein
MGSLLFLPAVVPLLSDTESVQKLLADSMYPGSLANADKMANMIIDRLGSVGCKSALRLAERAVASAGKANGVDLEEAQLIALAEILDDLAGDEATAANLCEVF